MRITGSERPYDPMPAEPISEVSIDIAGLGEAFAFVDMIEGLLVSLEPGATYDDGENIIHIVKAQV